MSSASVRVLYFGLHSEMFSIDLMFHVGQQCRLALGEAGHVGKEPVLGGMKTTLGVLALLVPFGMAVLRYHRETGYSPLVDRQE